jgi:hypothetical protein
MRATASIKGGEMLGLKALTRRINEANKEVWVGVPVGSGNAKEVTAKGEERDSTTPLAVVAAANEFGVAADKEKHIPGIPERSFLRGGLARGTPKFQKLNRLNLRLILLGGITIEGALKQLGNVAAGEVKREFRVGEFEPNAPSTLLAKKPKTHPLENTLQLRNSITFVLGKDGRAAG